MTGHDAQLQRTDATTSDGTDGTDRMTHGRDDVRRDRWDDVNGQMG